MTLATNHDTPFLENIIDIQYGVKELWSRQDMNMHTVRRTGRQTVRVIPILLHELCLRLE